MYGHTDPEHRRSELLAELKQLETPGASVLNQRLARAHPMHIARIARGLFLTLTILCLASAGLSLLLPFFGNGPRAVIHDIDKLLPIDLPVLAGILALCMAVAWVTATQAALSIARDCALLPWEEESRRKLKGELELLGGVSAGESQFAGAQADSRGGGDSLQMPNSTFASRVSPDQPKSYDAVPFAQDADKPRTTALDRLTNTPPATPGGTLVYGQGQAKGALRDPASGLGFPTPAPGLLGTPAPAGNTPTARPSDSVDPSPRQDSSWLSYQAPDGSSRPPSDPPAPRKASDPVSYERSKHSGYSISPHDTTGADANNEHASWNMPAWSPVDEPWLQDALRKAEALTRRYPVQAFLEFSVEPDLPFTLVLERATPAMAVRAMVDYVGFLASISTPRKARIELRSVVHLDRNFYRSVMSAMEPYFPDSVEIRQRGYRVEINFLEPDHGWARFPLLPMD